MTPRKRLIKSLNHEVPGQLCVDIGAGGQTGIGVTALHHLTQALFPECNDKVKVIEPYQMLGEVSEPMHVVGVPASSTLFGFRNENWKPFTIPDGVEVLVPGNFNYTIDETGAFLIYPEGDLTVPPSAKMPKESFFFDAISRQHSFNEEFLNPDENAEDFGILFDNELQYYAETTQKYI